MCNSNAETQSFLKAENLHFLHGLANTLFMSELGFGCAAPLMLQIHLWIPGFTCGFAGTLSGFTVTTPFKEAAAGGDDLEVVWNTGICIYQYTI